MRNSQVRCQLQRISNCHTTNARIAVDQPSRLHVQPLKSRMIVFQAQMVHVLLVLHAATAGHLSDRWRDATDDSTPGAARVWLILANNVLLVPWQRRRCTLECMYMRKNDRLCQLSARRRLSLAPMVQGVSQSLLVNNSRCCRCEQSA